MGALITCPLEVVKTQFQALHNRRALEGTKGRYTPAFVYAIKLIWSKEGLKGLFKGLGPNLVGVFPSRYS